MIHQAILVKPAAELMILFCGGAACMDLRGEKVDNGWALCGLGLFAAERWREACFLSIRDPDFPSWLLSMALPFLLLFPFFCFRMIGAGDIKVLMVTGLMMPPETMLIMLFRTFLFGAAFSVVKLIRNRNIRERAGFFITYAARYAATGKREAYCRAEKRPENLHMTIPILLAAVWWALGI